MSINIVIAAIQSTEVVISTLVFGLLLIVAIVAYSRSIKLHSLWEDAVDEGRLEKMSTADLLQPWLVRIYQRGKTYFYFANVLIGITAVVLMQVVYRSLPLGKLPDIILVSLIILRLISLIVVVLTLLNIIFSAQLGLRSEVRELRKKLPKYKITLDDLISLHDKDRYFSPKKDLSK